MSIRVLPELLINQIAAGEVIEDPLSIVKELIENALDAGAQTIDIELSAGGHRLIRVSDDGYGMQQDDAILCFERHATSKIRSMEDLESLTTMGFRGEALAAIAGVSKVTLRTATKKGGGTLVEMHGGKLLKVEPCSRMGGTTIEIRDLFFNVPARRKFQKSSQVSGAKIERWLSLFVLGYPEVTFSFRGLEKAIQWSKLETGLLGRIHDVYGSEFAAKQFVVEEKTEEYGLRGFISHIDLHRVQKTGQVVFVNRRLVQAPLVSHAVREAYATRLPEGRHPFFVLHLQLPSNQVDVNVHPQKKEVRFCDEEGIKNRIRSSIHKALTRPQELEKSPTPVYTNFQTLEALPWTLQEVPFCPNEQIPLPLPAAELKIELLLWHYLLLAPNPQLPFKEDFVVVDLRRAIERILEDHCIAGGQTMATQSLLISIHMELNKKEAEELRKRKEDLEAIGVAIAELGERLFCIERIPAGWDPEAVVSALIDFLGEEKKERFSATPFHRCIKKKFSPQEAEEILRTLLKSKNPYLSPSGQATMTPLQENDLMELF